MRASGSDHIITARAERRRALLDLIGAAHCRLLFSVFRCDDRHIVEALAAACRRGVRVEAILTRRAKDSRAGLRLLRLLLEQIGVTVWRYADPDTKYHAKYMVADDGLALVGSLNFTRKCFKRTSEFLVVTDDRGVVRALTALFEVDSGLRPAPPGDFSDRVIIGPEDSRLRLSALLQDARRSIQIIDSKLTDPSVLDLLRRKAAAGVDVQILGEKRLDGQPSHGRLLILDDRKAVVGSMALSPVSLDARREVALVVQEPQAVAALAHFFESARRFERAPPLTAVSRESVA